MKENTGSTGKTTIAIPHPAQQHIARSYRSKKHFFLKCHVRDPRCLYCILRVQIATKQLVEQQAIELIDSAKRRRLGWSSKLSSSKQQQPHSVQVCIVRKLPWHETSAGTPDTCRLRDGTRTSYSFRNRGIRLSTSRCGDTFPRGGDLHNNHCHGG